MTSPTVVFVDDNRKKCTIDGVAYIRSWAKPSHQRNVLNRKLYMRKYRQAQREKTDALRQELDMLIEQTRQSQT